MTSVLTRAYTTVTAAFTRWTAPRVCLGNSGPQASPILLPPTSRSALVTLPARTGKTLLALQAAQHWPGPVFLVVEDPHLVPVDAGGLRPTPLLPFRLRDLAYSAPGDWLYYEAPNHLTAGHKVALDASWCQPLGLTLSDGLLGLLHALARSARRRRPLLLVLDGLGHNLPEVDLLAVQRAAAAIPELTLIATTRHPEALGVDVWMAAAAQADTVLVHGHVLTYMEYVPPALADLVDSSWRDPNGVRAAYLSAGMGPVVHRRWTCFPEYTSRLPTIVCEPESPLKVDG